ncbi:MAG: DEAD/DEAH box helicase family protein, partial [Alphaproteobacteria bacterium]|nr:DEAD/DEAH box helicase family protein [Alphaproteobacteria bacterium]
MKLRFKDQKFQADAARAVCDVFNGQPLQNPDESYLLDPGEDSASTESLFHEGYGNANIVLSDEQILKNLRQVQFDNGLTPSISLEYMDGMHGVYQLSINMETGVGKTYTYIQTIYELNKRYGWRKFVIVVPSVAIREGVKKTFDITAETFGVKYPKTKIKQVFVFDSTNSSNLNQIDSFAEGRDIQVLIINMHAFNSKDRIFTQIQPERFKNRVPVNVLAQTRPIVIMDEPQALDGAATTAGLARFNPLMILRYSATHLQNRIFNMVYSLDAVEAFKMKLVKRISACGVEMVGANGLPYLNLIDFKLSKNKEPQAIVIMNVKTQSGVTYTKKLLSSGDNVFDLSGEMECYRGYIVENGGVDARPGKQCVSFINGKIIERGRDEETTQVKLIRQTQIRKTIETHLNKEERLYSKGIKVLSLFFIDRVSKYRIYDNPATNKGEYAQMFEDEYTKAVQNKINEIKNDLLKKDNPKELEYLAYLERNKNPENVHKGYFSQDSQGHIVDTLNDEKAPEKDKEAFDLIMKNKERLLSFEEPVRFVFSHSALKEGWDNPNVFQICMLKPMGAAENHRKQEVGRGLRICVNQNGDRMDKEVDGIGEDGFFDINTLTVVANESYSSFATGLQRELSDACQIRVKEIRTTALLGKGYAKTEDGEILVFDEVIAQNLICCLTQNGYLQNGKLTPKFSEDLSENKLILPEELKPYQENVVKLLRDANAKIPGISNADDEKHLRVNLTIRENQDFQTLWQQICGKSDFYIDGFDDEKFISETAAVLNTISIRQIRLRIVEGRMRETVNANDLQHGNAMQIDKNGVQTENIDNISDTTKYDLIGILAQDCHLTRHIIARILAKMNHDKLALFKSGPYDFIVQAERLINQKLEEVLVNCVKYKKIDGSFDVDDVFKEREISSDANIVETEKNIFNYALCDSNTENRFAQKLETSDNVLVYAKLPDQTRLIPIPGQHEGYTPDWAVAYKKDGKTNVYFVAETKGSSNENELRLSEKSKSVYAKKHFQAINSDKV